MHPGETASGTDRAALARAMAHAERWLDGLSRRDVPSRGTASQVAERLGAALPEHGSTGAEVIDRLAAEVEPALMASGSGRFYGWVMGGALPSTVAADWLVAAWDQNAGMRGATPGVVAVEDLAAAWLLQLLGLPEGSAVGFPTGATMANFTCLAAARHRVLRDHGWDDAQRGLTGGPAVRVLAGAERHGSVDLALRYLGLGAAELVAVDDEGRLDTEDLRARLAGLHGPTIVCLQAGNIHSGAFDPFEAAIEVAHAAGAWVHVDGAFGLWAAVSPALEECWSGIGKADSWATDAHKTLNTPYDCGISVVADASALPPVMGLHADYLLAATAPEPYEAVPEMSRRARGVPVWAAIATLGAEGVRDLVDGLHRNAVAIAAGVARIPGAEVLNDVVFTQVSVAFESDERTRAVLARVLAEGRILPSGSQWHGRAVIRFSVSSWRTSDEDVRETVEALERAAAAVPAPQAPGASSGGHAHR